MNKHLHRNRHRGATLVFVALWMGIALAAMMVLDIGHLVWQKREMQKIADMAALSGASDALASSCRHRAGAHAFDVGLRNGAVAEELTIAPGMWVPGQGPQSIFSTPDDRGNACAVRVQRSVPYFFVWSTEAKSRVVGAEAIAAQKSRLAQLSVRSQLIELDTKKSLLLNALVGGLLGGAVSLDVMSWQGLAGLDLELLDFLDALKIDLGLQAGSYEQLLDTQVGVGQLLEVAADVLRQRGNTAGVALNALNNLAGMALGVPSLQLKLAEILGVVAGGSEAALDTDLNVLDLVMASVQAGNSNSALSGAVNIPLGIANVALAIKVIEPPQLSLAKDPELARQDPYGDDKIYVRTAQTRLLLSVDLPVVNLATSAVDGVLAVLSPVLNLVSGILGGLSSWGEYMVIKVLPTPMRLDIGVDVAAGSAYLTDYQCKTGEKRVMVDSRSSALDLRIGKWGNSVHEAQANAFSSQSLQALEPVPVIRLDCAGCDGWTMKTLGLIQVRDEIIVTEQYFGGLGLELEVPLAANHEDLDILVPDGNGFSEPVSGGEPPNIVAGLGLSIMRLAGLSPLAPDPRASSGGIQGVLNALSGLLSSVLGLLNTLVLTLLAPLLDPILNTLLSLLGADLADAGVSARLLCGGPPELVY